MTTETIVAIYDAINAFQRTHRLPGLMHAQLRGLLAEHLARALPAAASVPPPADRAALRDRIADTVMPFLLNFSDEESARINAAEVATALLADVPAPAPVCICGHSKQQHFEDACLVCDCGDYLRPAAAREVIARYQEAAKRETADRPVVLNAAAQHLYTALFPAVYDDMGQKAAEGVQRAVSELRRLAAEEQPAETQDALPGPGTPRCATCTHPKSDHDGRADHRARFSPLVAGEPWCHACEAPCDYAARPAVGEQPDTQTREALCRCGHGRDRHAPDVYGTGTCADCPSDEERSWRHPFTPAP